MGLDMYLFSTNTNKRKMAQGACGGLFPLAPTSTTDDGVELSEIGYWRKNYKLQEFLFNDIIDTEGEDNNLVKFLLTESDCKRIVEFAKDEKSYIEETGDDDNGWYDIKNWEYTAKVFRKAIRHIKEGNEIYYECWY